MSQRSDASLWASASPTTVHYQAPLIRKASSIQLSWLAIQPARIPDPRTETLTADGRNRPDQPVDRGLAVNDDLQCVGLRGPGERVVGVHHVVQREVVGFEVVDL